MKLLAILLLTLSSYASGQSSEENIQARRIICTIPKAQILTMVKPIYPEEAKNRHISGPVTVQVAINKHGLVKTLTPVKGGPILMKVVMDALRQWRWKPYKLNGEPVEMESVVTVIFEPKRE